MKTSPTKLTTYVAALLALTASAIGCSAEKEAQEDAQGATLEESSAARVVSFLNGTTDLILRDRDRASLTITCSPRRAPDVFVEATDISEFFVFAKLRFIGGDADEKYRDDMALEQGEADTWTYDEDRAAYDVSSAISLLRVLPVTDRLMIDFISLEDELLETAIFEVTDLAEAERNAITTCMERNTQRVRTELGALGIDMAQAQEQDLVLWNYNVDVTKFRAAAEAAEKIILDMDSGVLQALAQNKTTFISDLVAHTENIGRKDEMEEFVQGAGYDTLEEWVRDGNAFYQAISIITYSREEPDTYQLILEGAEEDLATLQSFEKYAEIVPLVQNVPDDLIARVMPHYDFFVLVRAEGENAQELDRFDAYQRFLETMPLFNSGTILPALSPEESEEYSSTLRELHVMESLMEYYRQNYDSIVVDLWAATIAEYGFNNLDDWVKITDRAINGFSLVNLVTTDSQEYQKILALTDAEVQALDDLERERVILFRSYSNEEMNFLIENLEGFEEAFNLR